MAAHSMINPAWLSYCREDSDLVARRGRRMRPRQRWVAVSALTAELRTAQHDKPGTVILLPRRQWSGRAPGQGYASVAVSDPVSGKVSALTAESLTHSTISPVWLSSRRKDSDLAVLRAGERVRGTAGIRHPEKCLRLLRSRDL